MARIVAKYTIYHALILECVGSARKIKEWGHQRDDRVKEKYDSTHTDQQLKKQRKNQQLEQILKDLEDETLLPHYRAAATVTESSSDTEAT